MCVLCNQRLLCRSLINSYFITHLYSCESTVTSYYYQNVLCRHSGRRVMGGESGEGETEKEGGLCRYVLTPSTGSTDLPPVLKTST